MSVWKENIQMLAKSFLEPSKVSSIDGDLPSLNVDPSNFFTYRMPSIRWERINTADYLFIFFKSIFHF